MKKITTILLMTISFILNAQTTKNIEKIIQLGDAWKFNEAIDSLKHYISIDPENPELYYWLGRYAHYLVSDSRPYPGKGDQWSREEVLKPLQKAIELKPDYGDAKYFLTAEYGARAMEALRQGDIKQCKQELLEAEKWGGFPLHIIEHCRNVLKSCDPNTILIIDSDAYINTILFLQVIEGYRKDISVIGETYLYRPWYIKLIRDGVPGILKSVPINMSDNLIMEMHDYKWKENDIILPIPENVRNKFNLNDSVTQFTWHVKPDINKTMLQTATAMLINILEANQWARPVHYFWFGFRELNGLGDNMQIKGLTAEIVPVGVYGTSLEYDREKFESVMLNPENYFDYADIIINNQPRVSYYFGQMCRGRILNYAIYLNTQGETEKSKEVIKKMNSLMPQEVWSYTREIESGLQRLDAMTRRKLEELSVEGKSMDDIVHLIKTEDVEDSQFDITYVGIYKFGLLLMNEGKNEEALKIFESGIELYPDMFFLYDSYGECLILLGQKEKAMDAYKKSLELNPDNTNAAEFIKNNQ
jgi:tetratricopeptide (TPR) repeat protein